MNYRVILLMDSQPPRALTDQAGIRGIRVHYHRYGEGRSSASGYPSYPVLYSFDSAMGRISPWNMHPCFRIGLVPWIAISGNVSPNGLIHPVRAFCGGNTLSESGDKSVPGNLQKNPAASCILSCLSVISSSLPALQFSHDVPGAA